MTMQIANAVIAAAANSASRRAYPRVEKLCDSNAPNGERDEEAASRNQQSPRTVHHPLSRSGTEQIAPQWYEKRLSSPFVAQLLGQILSEEASTRRSTPKVYGLQQQNIPVILDGQV
jgi:hypothetical protein